MNHYSCIAELEKKPIGERVIFVPNEKNGPRNKTVVLYDFSFLEYCFSHLDERYMGIELRLITIKH